MPFAFCRCCFTLDWGRIHIFVRGPKKKNITINKANNFAAELSERIFIDNSDQFGFLTQDP